MTTASEPLVVQHECFLDQPEGASWFSSQDKTAPMARSSQSGTAAQHMLVDRYAETLWLGEHHTGLAHFLNCIDRLKSSLEPEHVLLGLCQLVKSNSAISRRHQELARKLLPLPDETVVKQTSLASIVSDYEIILAQRALDVSASGLRPTDASSFRDRWISSMESREIQLQILITMCLLHIASQDPRALESARSRFGGGASSNAASGTKANIETASTADMESEQPRKRSRKLEKAKRWRGTRPSSDSSDAFAWNQKVRKRLETDSSHDDGEHGEGDVLEASGGEVLAVDHLSKRLEALVDILCLRQVAAGIGSEIGGLLSDMGAETVQSNKDSQAKSRARGTLLGSSVRKLIEDDDMDDAQWLCSSVVEPHFEGSLPRQCSLFRSKCFVSLQSRTPARPTKSVRATTSGSPPTRIVKRNASVAAGGSSILSVGGAGLSDVLEKEQAGRRVKRNILAERSSMLGRGREVDMGRRLSRSISATCGPGHEVRAPTGVFSRSSTNASSTQPTAGMAAKPLKAEFASQRTENSGSIHTMRSPALGTMPWSAANGMSSSKGGSKRMLVMSTPQKEPANKALNMNHLSQIDKPRLVFPSNSLVMESPTQDDSQRLAQRSRTAERCASFAGRSSFALNRSPSPVAFNSDVDE